MVRGLERFREHFAGHEESYALIGGAACDILFGEAGLPFRVTRDFDIVLCVEVVGAEFGTVFADFLEAGGYQARERSTGRREFYRFHRPSDETFPAVIELFARRPDTQLLPEGAELAPIAVEEDVTSLSAILLDDDYFEVLQNMRRIIDDISLVDENILIPFKARAFLDLAGRKANGEDVDARHIRKHRADVFRLTQLLPGSGNLLLADPIRADPAEFLDRVSSDPAFDYGALKLPIALADAREILSKYYQLANTDQVRMSETPGSEARPYTETSALGDILEWSRARPEWLRDALRRLMVGSELSDRDIDELEAICLGSDGGASPLTDEHIAPQRLAGKPVSIRGLRDLVGVNALASGQSLTFAASGLTIVYG